MPVLNAQPVLDKYDPSCTIQDVYPVPNGGGWYVLAQNGNSAFVQVQYGPEFGSSTNWSEEQVLGSGAYGTIPANASGIRFRNAVAGKAQAVTVFLAPHNVPALGVQNLGTVNVVTGSTLNFQHNEAAVASEPSVSFDDSATLAFGVVDDIPNTRVKITGTVTFPVTSVFGRGGAVVAAAGDYTAAQVTNAADKSAAATQSFTGAVFSGGNPGLPTLTTGSGLASTGALRSVVAAVGSTAYGVAVANNADTGNRWQMLGSGTMQWLDGVGGTLATVASTTAGAPGSAGNGITTGAVIYCTGTQGFTYVAAVNNAAFLSFAAQADTVPMFKIFTQGAMVWGPGGSTTFDIEAARVVNSPGGTGSFLELINGDGFGFGVGTGGSATVAGVTLTLNTPTGLVSFTGQTNAASVPKSFTVTNSRVGARDTVIVALADTTTAAGAFVIGVGVTAGSFTITVLTNVVNAASTYAFNFVVIKGSST